MFKFLDSQLKRVNKNPGYIDFRDGSIIHSKYSEVEKDYNHGHLLPDYYKNFGHYSEERNNQIYLVSNNNLFIFGDHNTKVLQIYIGYGFIFDMSFFIIIIIFLQFFI